MAISLLSAGASAEGYFSGFKGARATGRGGAFVAKADDLSAVFFNPAALALMKGSLFEVSNRFSYNYSSYKRAPTQDYGNEIDGIAPTVSFDEVSNSAALQALEPLIGFASDFGLEDWGFALSAAAPPGVGRMNFPLDGGQRYMLVAREAQILTYSASAAWKVRELFGIGLSLQWLHVPKLDYSLVVDAIPFAGQANPVASDYDLLARTSGHDPFTFNAILGAWFHPASFLEFGISGQVIPSEIKTKSRLQVDALSSAIDEEVELTRDGLPADDLTLSLPLPMSLRVAARYVKRKGEVEHFDIELDIAYQGWSKVQNFAAESNGLSANLLGEDVAIGTIDIQKHWKNTLSLHLGGDFHAIADTLTLRGGIFYESSLAEPAYANVDFVGGQQLGAALGASIFFGRSEIAAAYGFRVQPRLNLKEEDARLYQQVPASACEAPYTDPISCNENLLGQPSPVVNAGSYFASTQSLSLDFIHRF